MGLIGLGITTFNRPDFFEKAVFEAIKYSPDFIVIYNDGSTKSYQDVYKKIEDKVEIIHATKNKGVAAAKNTLLKRLIEKGCEHLFLMEDDIIIKSQDVYKTYIKASNKLGFEHLNFAHHGPANIGEPLFKDETIAYYPHCVGAFSYYTKNCIEACGFMDENFKNAWEHVAHTKKIGDLGLTSPFGAFADVSNSKELLEEIEGSIDYSSIRKSKEWKKRMKEGLEYWHSIDSTVPVEMI